MPESKSGALPLGYIPIFTTDELYHKKVVMSRGYFDINILFYELAKLFLFTKIEKYVIITHLSF